MSTHQMLRDVANVLITNFNSHMYEINRDIESFFSTLSLIVQTDIQIGVEDDFLSYRSFCRKYPICSPELLSKTATNFQDFSEKCAIKKGRTWHFKEKETLEYILNKAEHPAFKYMYKKLSQLQRQPCNT